MNFDVKRVGDTAVLTTSGDLDLALADQLRDRLAETITTDPGRLVIDLTDATFVDSAILGVLVGARNQLGDQPGGTDRIHLVATRPAVLRVFRVTGLDTVFTIHSTLDRALPPA